MKKHKAFLVEQEWQKNVSKFLWSGVLWSLICLQDSKIEVVSLPNFKLYYIAKYLSWLTEWIKSANNEH